MIDKTEAPRTPARGSNRASLNGRRRPSALEPAGLAPKAFLDASRVAGNGDGGALGRDASGPPEAESQASGPHATELQTSGPGRRGRLPWPEAGSEADDRSGGSADQARAATGTCTGPAAAGGAGVEGEAASALQVAAAPGATDPCGDTAGGAAARAEAAGEADARAEAATRVALAAGAGPKAAALIADDARYLSPSCTRGYPLAVARGEGMYVYDVDGRRYLDFTAGIAVTATGHCHPRIVEAIERQARTLLHMSGTDFYYGPQVELARRLAEAAPGPAAKRVFFTNSGAEAVEAALKLARYATGRPRFLAFQGAFHGRTFGALAVSASKAVHTRGFAPLLPQVTHVPYASCYRCAYHLTYPGCGVNCVEAIERLYFQKLVPPDEVAAVIVEPIQGEGGYLVPPAEFLPRLRELCDRHGILLIADEVQTGMGRTGRLFACEHAGVAPDIVVLAKGLASGLPLGAMIARSALMTWGPGAHASTFGGNPVACAAALATLDLLEGGLVANAAAVGAHLLARLKAFTSTNRFVGDVRGVGLMVGMELVKNRTTREPAVRERDRVIQKAFERGLLLLGCGTSAIRFCPPLIVTREQVDEAVAILDACLAEVMAEANGGARRPAEPSRSASGAAREGSVPTPQ